MTSAAAAGTDTYVVSGGRSVGGIRIGQTVPREAVDLFGGPRLLRTDRGDSCLGNWPEIGLTVRFFSFDHGPCWAGVAVMVTITSRDAWRTVVGLRVGDSVARVRRLYPQALRQTKLVGAWNGYWLVTRSACAQTGRWGYPALLARVCVGVRSPRSSPAAVSAMSPSGRARHPPDAVS